MKRLPIYTICFLGLIGIFFAISVKPSFAAAIISITGPSSGNSVTLPISVNTNGTAENSFDVVVNFSGQVTNIGENIIGSNACSFDISPSHGSSSVELTCGKPNPGFSGQGLIGNIVASVSNNATFSIVSAKVLQNDGKGTPDSVGYGNTTVVVDNSGGGGTSTPTPTPTSTPSSSSTSTPTPTTSNSGGSHSSNTPTPSKANATPVSVTPPGSFQGKPTQVSSVTAANQPSLIVVSQPPYKTPKTPTGVIQQITVTPTGNSNIQTVVQGYFTNTLTTLLFVVPILLLLGMVAFMSVRMYQLNRRRQREIELLFEHELGELAALESKMDILSEKGSNKTDEFKAEFERTRDQILKEIKPDYIGNDQAKKDQE